MGIPKQDLQARSERMSVKAGELDTVVKYSLLQEGDRVQNAQFTDISDSGMKIVARHASHVRVGDAIQIEFTVPGSESSLKNSAQVVRRINEFVFAVRFSEMEEQNKLHLRQAIAHRFSLAWWMRLQKSASTFKTSLRDNRQALILTAIALLVFGIIGSVIFLNSDEHLGRGLRGWGEPYPQQWDLDYVKNFHGQKSGAETAHGD